MFRIADGRKSFYQWDVNRQIIVEDPTITEVHFCNKTDDCSLVVEVYADPLDSEVKADVPNILLQNDFPIRVYAYCGDGYTKIEETFKVITRTKPSDYVYTETEVKTLEEIEQRVSDIESKNYVPMRTFSLSVESLHDDITNSCSSVERYAREYTDKAIANIEIPEANIPEDITVDSIVIGEGIAADLSIAGGTTDTSFIQEIAEKEYGSIGGLVSNFIPLEPSKAEAPLSIALGANNVSSASGAVTFGYDNTSDGWCSTAVGAMNEVTGSAAFTYGFNNKVKGDFGVAFGEENEAGEVALAGGILSKATGKGSIAFGNECEASEEYAVALGGDCTASGKRSFASGTNTTAKGDYSHAQNEETTASGESSTAMGYKTEASGNQAFAGGRETIASARNSTALGFKTEANHEQSFTSGRNLITGRENQTVVGEYNAVSTDALFVVGNGINGSARNAFEVKHNNRAYINGKEIATENYVDNAISNIDIPKTDLTDYYTKEEVNTLISDIDIPAPSSNNIYYIDPSKLTQDGNRFILTDDLKEFADKVVADDTVLLKIHENNSWCETVVYKFSDTNLLIKRRDLTVDDLHKDANTFIKGYKFIKDDNGWYLREYEFTFQVDVASKKYVNNAIPDVSNYLTEAQVNALISSALSQIGVAEGGSY